MLVLGIESSCDDTSVAVVENGVKIRSQVSSSQIDLHAIYGGVVPEVASRSHLEKIGILIQDGIKRADLKWEEIDGVSVTSGPGLIGSLLVGLQAAKGVAAALKKPFIGVNHLKGHIYSAFLEDLQHFAFPFLGVVVSGGHSALYRVTSWHEFELLGSTRDDAAGEAFDKIAKWLGLGFPGGPIIDTLALRGDPHALSFPRPLIRSGDFDMSFSGIKSAVIQYLQNERKISPSDLRGQELYDLVASFREAIVDVLICKIELACERFGFRQIIVSGGVAANARLRERLAAISGIKLKIPPIRLCTDNAAMIAGLGFHYLNEGISSPYSLNANPRMSIG